MAVVGCGAAMPVRSLQVPWDVGLPDLQDGPVLEDQVRVGVGSARHGAKHHLRLRGGVPGLAQIAAVAGCSRAISLNSAISSILSM